MGDGSSQKELEPTPFGQAAYWPNNFNDFPSAFITLFELLVVNNWHVLMNGFVTVAKVDYGNQLGELTRRYVYTGVGSLAPRGAAACVPPSYFICDACGAGGGGRVTTLRLPLIA